MKSSLRTGSLIGGLAIAACGCLAVQSASKLFIDGQLASNDVRVINGQSYVPVKDVAAALHLHLGTSPGGISLSRDGGANQVQGLTGTVGDKEIFTGKWRFWAKSVQQIDSYTLKYSADHDTIVPRVAGDTLVVVDCRIKNGQSTNQEMIMTTRQEGHDALTDDMEHSYQPIAFDAHNENGPYGGPTLLPGAAGEFAVIFSVPKGIKLKDFVFTVFAQPGDNNKGTDLRISIPKQ